MLSGCQAASSGPLLHVPVTIFGRLFNNQAPDSFAKSGLCMAVGVTMLLNCLKLGQLCCSDDWKLQTIKQVYIITVCWQICSLAGSLALKLKFQIWGPTQSIRLSGCSNIQIPPQSRFCPRPSELPLQRSQSCPGTVSRTHACRLLLKHFQLRSLKKGKVSLRMIM